MNLDEKIKQALQIDTQEVEQLLLKDTGLLPRALSVFKGSMRRWNIFGMVLAIIVAAMLFWSGYHFFTSNSLEERLFWGVISLAFLTANVGTKIWFWMEMNRHSTRREIKRLELAIAQLTAKLSKN